MKKDYLLCIFFNICNNSLVTVDILTNNNESPKQTLIFILIKNQRIKFNDSQF